MTIWTLVTLLSCGAVLLIVLYLNWHPRYCVGPIRAIGFSALGLGCVSPLFEIYGGSEYRVFPATAVMSSGIAIFMLSHWIAFEVKSRKSGEVERGTVRLRFCRYAEWCLSHPMELTLLLCAVLVVGVAGWARWR